MASDMPEPSLNGGQNASSNTSENVQLDVPKYTEQDMQNAIRGLNLRLETLKVKIEDTIKCNVCKDVPREGEIKQCQNGHLYCEDCMKNASISTCALCREPLGNKRIRALTVEQLIEAVELELPCKHPDCEFKGQKRDLITHHKKCKYRIVPCPDTDCEQLVPFLGLLDHMGCGRETHTSCRMISDRSLKVCYDRSEFILQLASSTKNPRTRRLQMKMARYTRNHYLGWRCRIHTFKEFFFASAIKRQCGIWYAYMYILGDPEEAKKFSVKISIGGIHAGMFCYGQVFPIDAKREDILKETRGVLSFRQEGMTENFFQDKEYRGQMEKELAITYEIIENE